MASEPRIGELHRLARLYGVQPAYYDVHHRRQQASPDALLRLVGALGAPVAGLRDVPAALRARRAELWQRSVEPVVVAWEGGPARLAVALPARPAAGDLACRLRLESGEVRRWVAPLARAPRLGTETVDGVAYVVRQCAIPGALPWGYHRLTLEAGGRRLETLLLAAPARAVAPSDERAGRRWGVFLPLYALHSARSWGSGDFSDLEALQAWVAGLGGGVVATLPLLAAFLDAPLEPSPYSPVSRLLWNEFYVDPARAPELESCPPARQLLESADLRAELAALRASPLVDYRRGMALKRRVLEELARGFFAGDSPRRAAFRSFVESHPAVEDYARFRATGERRGAPWPAWPPALRDGTLRDGEWDPAAERYHLYAQWLAHEQLRALAEGARRDGRGLYLDLPLGVHPDGYDCWRERESFASGVRGGAPPDAVFTRGQNWGFPPLHPEAVRRLGYRYPIAYLRHHLAYAGILRIDHMMGLHRLFWIPEGAEPRDGAYVRYPAEECYAILTIEARRAGSTLVGENLGTVPAYVNAAMARHGVHQMYVVQYEVTPRRARPLRPVPARSVASLNTHDMPTFAAFWRGLDIDDRLRLRLLDPRGRRAERTTRQAMRTALADFLARRERTGRAAPAVPALLRACLGFLGASPAGVVLVNLEDLWLETEPQNVPATREDRPNWRRKGRHGLEVFSRMPAVLDALREVDRRRRPGPPG